mmetsp:Transcript_530/g.468  ORF Transcript_530/g.468 Transcript_530/m.468 type:complete len:93 (-) Transcript_530:22-300(-)
MMDDVVRPKLVQKKLVQLVQRNSRSRSHNSHTHGDHAGRHGGGRILVVVRLCLVVVLWLVRCRAVVAIVAGATADALEQRRHKGCPCHVEVF